MNETLPIVHFLFAGNCGANKRATVCSDSPVAQRMIGTSELQCTHREYTACRTIRQAPYRFSICRSRLLTPAPKVRCAERELYPKGSSDRPDRSRCRRGQARVRPNHPRSGYQHAGRPIHDPLVTGSRAAGETAGPRHGQGAYLQLKSLSSDPRPTRKPGGEGSGKRTYGDSR